MQQFRYLLSSFVWLGALFSILGFVSCLIIVSKNLELMVNWKFLIQQTSSLEMNFYIDFFSLLFFSSVTTISTGVMLYSISYMQMEKYFFRFLFLKISFIVSMVLLIFSSNFILVILGWDGLGLTSFLLVIYYHNSNSTNSGLLTVFTNRLGDIGLIFSMIMFIMLGSWNFYIFDKSGSIYSSLGVWMMFISCITKSAQLPFSAWLPAAMAAPTPISSLVHSSTLVTAGVYLVFRFSNFYNYSSFFLFVGILTCTMATLASAYEFDSKKIVALSTLSHLSLMVIMLSLGFKNLMFTHLIFHAYFKALLFMSMGLIIHLSGNFQDSRKMSNLKNMSLLNSVSAMISIMSLCGLPFLTGFYSKDFFMELLLISNLDLKLVLMIYFSCLGSFIYSYRLMLILLKNNMKMNLYWGYYNNKNYYNSYLILLILSVFAGSYLVFFLGSVKQFIFLEMAKKLLIYMLILGILFITLKKMKILSISSSISENYFMSMFFFTFISKNYMLKKKNNLMQKIFFFEMKLLEFTWQKSMFNAVYISDKLNFFESFFPSLRYWGSWFFWMFILI